MTILPALKIRCSSVVYGGPGSAPSKRYGWLQHLRSCMTMLRRRVFDSFLPAAPLTASMSFSRIFLYHLTCISDMPIYRLTSFLGNKLFSTSLFTRLSRKGLRTLCSCWTTVSWSSFWLENHWSNASASPKTSGKRKFRSAQSSWRLFCRGVPVISRRFLELNSLMIWASDDSTFLMRCASSMMMYSQANFFRWAFSRRIIS